MRRRDFIKVIAGSAAVWPLTARAQQAAIPVIGLLTFRGPNDAPHLLAAIRQGLKEAGFVEGQNVAIEYRFAENHNERLPLLAIELVQRRVAVILATTTPAVLAAKAATTTIPIVFEVGGDPIRLGLVASLDRPGGNITGVSNLNVVVAPKRLQLLHEMIPSAKVIALLVDPIDVANTEAAIKDMQAAALALGLELHVVNASSERDFDGVFEGLIQSQVGGLVIAGSAFYTGRAGERFAALALRNRVPAVYEGHDWVTAGGLMSYGGNLRDAYRLAGVYAARVLKGERPAELPVQQGTKLELYINLTTAKALGISVPNTLIGRADELIE
jgi:putative ABC transport system substrate-binding protein